jgi:ABC-type polysaccharide/polyol phosphate transport system ATPase subunit
MKTVEVSDVSKRYFLRKEVMRSLKSTVLGLLTGKRVREDLWALKDVSFSAEQGETVGVIGANGAGKSTLLGIIAGTITPTSGNVHVEGRMSTLLELGAGFHPDLTGRENIFLNGSILGLSRKYVQERFSQIVNFAGLSEFVDMPVKHYSSGMYVRLGFAVAVEVDPDVLLVDEVLAVGDEEFRKKCIARMADFQQAGKTIVVVSHDLETVKKMCHKVVLLGEGKIVNLGDPEKVVEEYKRLGLQQQDAVVQREWGTREAVISSIRFSDEGGNETSRFRCGDPIAVTIAYACRRRIDDPIFGFSISDYQGKLCYGSNTIMDDVPIDHMEGEGNVQLTVDSSSLMRGKFYFSFSLHSRDHQSNYHRLDNMHSIWITSDVPQEGFVRLASEWKVP